MDGKWQPIDTAPKDGTKILGFDPVFLGICIAGWSDVWRVGWYVDRNSQDGMGFEDVRLTHWMPMPDLPDEVV